MTEALVRIISEPPAIRVVGGAGVDTSMQVVHLVVTIEGTEQEHIVVNPYPITPNQGSCTRISTALNAENPSAIVSVLLKEEAGKSVMYTSRELGLGPIGVAAAVAAVKTCWGWDESPSIEVQVNETRVSLA